MAPPTTSVTPELRLDGKAVLVSGGGSGIGLAIAHACARAGAAVAIAGRRADVLEQAATELRQHGGRVCALPGSVADPNAARQIAARAASELPGIHVLVNNAGIARAGPIEAASDRDVDETIDTDLKGPIHLLRAALPHLAALRDRGGAVVINVSTSVTLAPIRNFSLYIAAKSGLDALTRAWALELADRRIRVNAICPGIVRTPIFESMMPKEEVPGLLARFEQAVPLGRTGSPDDVAHLALFLASPLAAYLTGAVIPLDGGLHLAADGK